MQFVYECAKCGLEYVSVSGICPACLSKEFASILFWGVDL